jgi:hypothetical protein
VTGGEHESWRRSKSLDCRCRVIGAGWYSPDATPATAVTTDDLVWKFFAAHPEL